MVILNQIWSDDNYVFAATTSGVDIIDKTEEDKIAYINNADGFNSVWANDDKVYLSTSASGIKYFNKTCVSGTVLIPNDLITCLMDHVSPFGISSQTIRYIHGSEDNYLMCCTVSGVDVYYMKPTKYRSSATTIEARKCFMTSTGKFYYTSVSGATVSGESDLWSLNRVDKPLWDWTTPDYSYTAGGGILPAGIGINDIFITENTASNTTDNVVFMATTSGVYVIDEGNMNYYNYFTTSVSGGVLIGTDNNFTAIWADSDAGLSIGRLYIASAPAFSVVSDTVLIDYYTTTHVGRTNESLDQDDITDINA